MYTCFMVPNKHYTTRFNQIKHFIDEILEIYKKPIK